MSHLSTPEILLLRHFYAGRGNPLTSTTAAGILNVTPNGARYQLEKLYSRGWILRHKEFVVYYGPVKSPLMREKILQKLNEVLY